MAELAPHAAKAAAPRILREPAAAAIEVIEVVEAVPAEVVLAAEVDVEVGDVLVERDSASRLAVGTSESAIVAVPAVEAVPELEPSASASLEPSASDAGPAVAKKKRTRKPKGTAPGATTTTTPRRRKKAATELAPIVAAPIEEAAAKIDIEVAEPAKIDESIVAVADHVAVDAGVVEDAKIEVVDGSATFVAEASGLWTPKMPVALPSVPWRRPTQAVPVSPSIVIDDADPDSAERELEDRREARTSTLRSFLPPILLDREDRSARQGGLTLAVIILLIAATLTLSYLMRRPGTSGDGMTEREPATLPIA